VLVRSRSKASYTNRPDCPVAPVRRVADDAAFAHRADAIVAPPRDRDNPRDRRSVC
jgi:hypothetical protein